MPDEAEREHKIVETSPEPDGARVAHEPTFEYSGPCDIHADETE